MQNLNGDPLPWLLEVENPSVRYWTLVDILDYPRKHPDVVQAQALVNGQALAQDLFASQHPDGHWGDDETKPYTAQGAIGVLALLAMLGVTPDDRAKAGCDSLLRNCQHESGGLSLVRATRSGIFSCTTGEHLPFLIYFGLGDDPRVRRAFAFLIQSMGAEKALTCGRNVQRTCLWGAIAALNGLAALPEDMKTAEAQAVTGRLADALLDGPYDFAGEHKRWLTFGVPRAWDLLSALKALAAHGRGGDPRFAALMQRALDCQDEQGRWLCGSVSRTWPLEKRNRPSKWVTLDALRMLKRAGQTF